jgi:exodeoxyribonuclease VII small subunit
MTAPTPPSSLAAQLARLEEIVRQLEDDEVDLDTSLALFEQGVACLREARARLADAQLKVQSVLADSDGSLRLTDFEA